MNGTLVSKHSLQQSSIEIRTRNVGIEVEDQLNKQFGITSVGGGETLALILKQIEELIKAAPRRSAVDPRTRMPRYVPPPPTPEHLLAGVIATNFPFISQSKALSMLRPDVTVDELISQINFEAGV